ncbi:MAG TPA: heme o synthase [Dehalococcoidia bacterium]|nr:heme o synthase [Dehalococcoidia bacterium]
MSAGSVAVAPASLGWRRTAGAYFALTKPRIIELLLVTTFPAMVVAADGIPNLWIAFATLLGGALAAGGANTINCYVDRDIDAIMTRTHSRPIPAGLIKPAHALTFGISLGVIAFVFLTLAVNLLTACLAVSAILFYVFIYTIWLKRSTVENIVIGGAAGAIPPLCGWAAVTNRIEAAPLIMFAIVFLWTPPHFWALAISYTNDYASAGVPMLPVKRGALETRRRSFVYAIVTVAISLTLYLTGDVGLIYLASASLFGAIFVWLAWQQIRQASVRAAMSMFKYSMSYLALIFIAMVADRLIPL